MCVVIMFAPRFRSISTLTIQLQDNYRILGIRLGFGLGGNSISRAGIGETINGM
jgi:hypothetical protein